MHVSKVRPELRAAVKESDGRGQQHMWPYDVDARFNRLQLVAASSSKLAPEGLVCMQEKHS